MKALFALRTALLDRAPDLDPALGDLLRMPPREYRQNAARIALDPDVTKRRIRALLGHEGPRYLSRITCPALVIGTDDDRIVPPHLTQALRDALPTAQCVMLPDGGHFFPQTRPKLFADHVLSWLGRVA